MRQKNWRVIIVGIVLLLLAIAFFFGMVTMAHKSNDPVEMMRVVGQVSGAVGGISIVMIIFGLIGKKRP
jgi:hypothetical protein